MNKKAITIEADPTIFIILAVYRRVRKKIEELAKEDSSWEDILMVVRSVVLGMEVFGSVLLATDLDDLVKRAEDEFGEEKIEETAKKTVANYASIRRFAGAGSLLENLEVGKNLPH